MALFVWNNVQEGALGFSAYLCNYATRECDRKLFTRSLASLQPALVAVYHRGSLNATKTPIFLLLQLRTSSGPGEIEKMISFESDTYMWYLIPCLLSQLGSHIFYPMVADLGADMGQLSGLCGMLLLTAILYNVLASQQVVRSTNLKTLVPIQWAGLLLLLLGLLVAGGAPEEPYGCAVHCSHSPSGCDSVHYCALVSPLLCCGVDCFISSDCSISSSNSYS